MDIALIYKKFPTRESCIKYLEETLWNNKPVCPYCKSELNTKVKNDKYNVERYHCNKCNTTYSVLVNTIFQDTKLELQKWFYAIYYIKNNEKISSRKLAKELNVNPKTAWYIQTKIKLEIINSENVLLEEINKTIGGLK